MTQPRAPLVRWTALRDKKAALKEVSESFLIHRHDLSQATQDNYRLQFRLYDSWVAAQLGRPTRVEDVEPGIVNAYLDHRRTTVSAQTAHSAWKALRSLATFLAERRIQSDHGASVLEHIRAPRIKDEPRRALTDEELLRLLAAAGDGETGHRDRAIVMTLLVCGIRRGELCGLRLGDVDLAERRLHVRAATSKSGEARDVTLHLEAGKELDVYINDVRTGDVDPDAPLFTDTAGNALTGNAVRKLFDRLKVATGIDDLCAHMLRHTWATNYHRSASGSRFDLQTEGGWRTGRMVERYTKSRPFEERRRGPSPLTAFREATKGKRPAGKRPVQQGSGLTENRTATRANIHAAV
jgi:integrase